MKLCILGAAGNSGRTLVRSALARGHDVTAIVRNEAKIADLAHTRLSIGTTSLEDDATLSEAMRGHDAVINAAGNVSDGPAFIRLVQGVVRATANALGAGGRFWLFGGAALLDVPGTSICTLDLPGVPGIYEAHRSNLDAVRGTALDWSMLCPGPMIDAPGGLATEGLIVSVEVWPTAHPLYLRLLPRIALSIAFKQAVPHMTLYYEDAAQVILDNLQRGALSRKRVGVALPGRQTRLKPGPTR